MNNNQKLYIAKPTTFEEQIGQIELVYKEYNEYYLNYRTLSQKEVIDIYGEFTSETIEIMTKQLISLDKNYAIWLDKPNKNDKGYYDKPDYILDTPIYTLRNNPLRGLRVYANKT